MFPKSRFDGDFPSDAKTKKKLFLLWLSKREPFVCPFANRFCFFTNISIPWLMAGKEEAFIALLHFSPHLLNTS